PGRRRPGHRGGRRGLRAQGSGRRHVVGVAALARGHRPDPGGDGARRRRSPRRGRLHLQLRPRDHDGPPARGARRRGMTTRVASGPSVLALAAPALVVLAAEPLYLLVDTAVVGHLGTVPLGGLAVGGALLGWAAALLN